MYNFETFQNDAASPAIDADFLNKVCNILESLGIQTNELNSKSVTPIAVTNTGSPATAYTLDVTNVAEPTNPTMFIFTPTVTSTGSAKINAQWSGESSATAYDLYDLSTGNLVTASTVKANQPNILIFDGTKFWLIGDENYLKLTTDTTLGGYFYKGTTTPTKTTRLNYNGYLYATRLYGAVYNSNSADIAEGYPIKDDVEAGDIISINENGEYVKNTIAYNPKCIGVVSDSFAALYGTKYGGIPVALCGRVGVKVAGECHAGDMLVASGEPGVACVAYDTSGLSNFQIIGMALENKTDIGVSRVLTLVR